ncbi:hypothetical protein J6O48_13975 [bacterium]|nr:hypothetical protein [bacterium]
MNKNIKYLVENILDDFYADDNEDIISSFHNYSIHDVIESAKKYLCNNNDDIKPVNGSDNSFYVHLRQLFKLKSIGPRKRKQYPESFFYSYIITVDIDGIILYIN